MSWTLPVLMGRDSAGHILREGQLLLVDGCDCFSSCHVLVTDSHFLISLEGTQEVVLPWRWIYGCHCLRGSQTKSQSAYFCIYAYPPTKKKRLGAICQRQVITFAVDYHRTFGDNMELAKMWQTLILDCIHDSVPEALRIPKPQLPYLVFVNRKSGPGQAFSIFEKSVNSVFAEADVPYKLVLTERANHAREMVYADDLTQYRGIVLVSGDGLIYEVLNGLFERDDWREVVPKIPIGVVAGGSGNGLASALCYASGLSMIENIHMHNALLLAKPMLQPMDVVRVETRKASHISFLSVTWAMIADIDIQSERLRRLGGARFTVAAFVKIMGARTYHGTIAFLPDGGYDPNANLPLQRRRSSVGPPLGKSRVRHSESCTAWAPVARPETLPAPLPHPRRLHRSITLPSASQPRFTASEEAAASLHLDDVDRQPRPPPIFTASGATRACGRCVGAPEPSLLPPLGESVPDGWMAITDHFLVFCATYQTHIATDAFVMPRATLSDRLIHLMLIRAGASRATLFNILTSLENGEHVNSPYLEMIPCRAFRLIPHTSGGIISVDGERVDYGPIQAEVHSQRVAVITQDEAVKTTESASDSGYGQPSSGEPSQSDAVFESEGGENGQPDGV